MCGSSLPLPPFLPPPLPPQCCGHHWHVPCVSVVLQVRAASTVTSWSNQTPAALPTVPPPLQVGSAPDHQVLWTPTQPSHNVLRCWCLQMITRSLAWLMLQPTCWSTIFLPAFYLKHCTERLQHEISATEVLWLSLTFGMNIQTKGELQWLYKTKEFM